jgi:hypothetical protein
MSSSYLTICFAANPNKKEKLQQFREIVKALPLPNRDTLEFLLRHLLRSVTVALGYAHIAYYMYV